MNFRKPFQKDVPLVMEVTPISVSPLSPDAQNFQKKQPRYHFTVVSPPPPVWNHTHLIETDQLEHATEEPGIQFWKTYYEFAYYLLVCPFRFDWDSQSQSYLCHTSKLQTALHRAIFTIFGICYLLRLRGMWCVHTTTSTKSLLPLINTTYVPGAPTTLTAPQPILETAHENPTAYFDMTVYFFDSFFMLILFLHFGRQKEQVYQVFKEFQTPMRATPEPSSMGQFVVPKTISTYKYQRTRLWSTLILLGCMGTVGIKMAELVQNESWDLSQFFHEKTKESKVMFLDERVVDAVPWFFVILNVGSSLYEKVLNDFGDILFTMSVLLFKNLVDNFAHAMTLGGGKNEPNLILEHYLWLKGVTAKINLAIGTMTFAFIAGNLPFFATTVLEVFGSETKNVFVRIRYIIACCYFFPSICIGALANKRVDDVKEWISKEENYKKIPETKLLVFLHDLTFHSVGLTAKGILTLNWNSVGSIISIILTYALLKSQFK